jgi:hypothetical protein
MRLHWITRRRAAAALALLLLAGAGAARMGHAQEHARGGLWRGSDGNLYCGGACGASQVCCTITIGQT